MYTTTIFPVTSHTTHVGPGSTFVAVQGYKEDGIRYIPQAIAQGAKKIVVQSDAIIPAEILELIKTRTIILERVDNARKALALLSAQAAGYPAQKLNIIGITGTKGKTSTCFILEHILRAAGKKTALLGTVKNSINGIEPLILSSEAYRRGNLTTPQPDYLHQFFKLCVEQEVEYVVMEVAAQALTLHRVEGIQFAGVIFTNFGQEHAEFYATLDDYFNAKCIIFKQIASNSICLINEDDEKGRQILQQNPQFQEFSLNGDVPFEWIRQAHHERLLNSVRPEPVEGSQEFRNESAHCCVHFQDNFYQFFCPALIGNFNNYNLLASVRMALELGIEPAAIEHSLQTFTGVPGRLEMYKLANGALGIIDYAHNPSSFQAVLSTLRGMTEQLIVVFGCGGDRDATKRPLMGALAAEYADLVVLTSDNPRSEDPATIIEQIYSGISKHAHEHVWHELDREKAIQQAYKHAKSGSIIALLGKGPDEYQQIGAVKYPFSEKAILKEL